MFVLINVDPALIQPFLDSNLLGMRLFNCATLRGKYIPLFLIFQGLTGKILRFQKRLYIAFLNRVGTVRTLRSLEIN